MPLARLRIHTGPGTEYVRFYAEKLREAGIKNVVEGTEHVYLDMDFGPLSDPVGASECNVRAMLHAQHGRDYGLRPEFLFVITQDGGSAPEEA